MKNKIILLTLIFLSPLFIKAQSINGKKVSELETGYIIMTAEYKLFEGKFRIALDYGQDRDLCRLGKNRLKGEDGNDMKFSSIVEALNLMDNQGYELISTYTEMENSVHYVLRRKQD